MKAFLVSLFGFMALAWPTPAQDAAAQLAQAKANEQRLRESLRAVTQQLRAAETEKATLLAAQAERDQKVSELETRLTRLTGQTREEKAVAEKNIAELKAAGLKAEQEVARLGVTLDKWKAAYHQAARVAKTSDTVRAKLAAANVVLERKAEERERQNLELYKTAKEILQRYSSFGLGRAIAAREPFTGIARARLEEQVQSYADKLEDGKLKPASGDGRSSTTPMPANSAPPSPAR